MVYKGSLNKRDGEIQVYLFDHALLFTKLVKTKQHEQYRVYRRVGVFHDSHSLHCILITSFLINYQPIPLELLLITSPPEENGNNGTVRSQQRNRQALVRRSSPDRTRGVPSVVSAVAIRHDHKGQHWINFIHLGRKYYNLMLWSTSPMGHKKWLEVIYKQQQIMRERSIIFDTFNLSEGFFSGPNKVNCAAPYSGFLILLFELWSNGFVLRRRAESSIWHG